MDDRQAGGRRDVPELRHRRLIEPTLGFRPVRGSDLFSRIGGAPTIDRLVDLLYEGIDGDPELRPLFPRDLAQGRAAQQVFFAEWLGGPARYSDASHSGLLHRHVGLPITPGLAGRWLGHFRKALEATVESPDDRLAIFAAVRSMASVLVNDSPADERRTRAWTANRRRVVTKAAQLAHRGDVDGLERAVEEAPDLLRPRYAGSIMHAGALAGRVEVVRLLLDRAVSPDVPFYLPVGVSGAAFERVLFVTPLCAARMKNRESVEKLLIAAGAHDDVFTSAYLGDAVAIRRSLASDPDLARTFDPATDALDITPIEHAVAGGHTEVLRVILGAAGPGEVSSRALRGAAERRSLEMVEVLLDHGADATRIGVGRWVLDPVLAAVLTRHGASIDASGSWIGASCTGNQGRRDDPEYVRALLQHGAHATDRRRGTTGQATGIGSVDATALHYAAKAGFVETIEVLLDNGADPGAVDNRGRTPSDWLEEAAPTVDREAVRRGLEAGDRNGGRIRSPR